MVKNRFEYYDSLINNFKVFTDDKKIDGKSILIYVHILYILILFSLIITFIVKRKNQLFCLKFLHVCISLYFISSLRVRQNDLSALNEKQLEQ